MAENSTTSFDDLDIERAVAPDHSCTLAIEELVAVTDESAWEFVDESAA